MVPPLADRLTASLLEVTGNGLVFVLNLPLASRVRVPDPLAPTGCGALAARSGVLSRNSPPFG